MTDERILENLRQNRYSHAVKGLYSIIPDVKKFIKANSGSVDDAEDIFQDALVILCKKVQSENFILTAPLKNYLLGIVRNCWMQELRVRKKMPAGEMNGEVENTSADEEAAFAVAKAAFDLLGEKCRQLLILFYFKKHDFKTIAAELSFGDEKTAKNQKYRCLQKAKENYITLSNNSTHEG